MYIIGINIEINVNSSKLDTENITFVCVRERVCYSFIEITELTTAPIITYIVKFYFLSTQTIFFFFFFFFFAQMQMIISKDTISVI